MPIFTFESLTRSALDKSLPGSQSLPASAFRGPSVNGNSLTRLPTIENEDGIFIIMCGVTKVEKDNHVCGQ